MPHALDLEKQFDVWWERYRDKFPWLDRWQAKQKFFRERLSWEEARRCKKREWKEMKQNVGK